MFNEKQQKLLQAAHHHRWWHSSLLRYPFAVLFAVAASLIPLYEKLLNVHDFFVGPPFVIATLLVGWFWGMGPALLALLLEIFIVDYWIVPPVGVIDFFRWPMIVSFAPFILIQLLILVLIKVQKNYRQQLLRASQEVAQHAEELAASNVQIQQTDRVKDLFLSMASHELRTLVTYIHGTVQLLQRRLERQHGQPLEHLTMYDVLEKVGGQTQQLTDMINDLLDINTLRSGKMPVHLAPYDLRRLCQHVIEEQQTQTDRSIDLRLSDDSVVVQVDPERFSQVVRNLVTNALKYSPANTPVCMEIHQKLEEAVLEVHNEGPVIPKEQQEMFFEPFYRSPEARSSTVPGWGLGLAISKEIVMQHGGRIWVESLEGKGTSFFVFLPLLTRSESA